MERVRAWPGPVRWALLSASVAVTLLLLYLGYREKPIATSPLTTWSVGTLEVYWMYMGAAICSALIGIIIYKYGFPTQNYHRAGPWWASISVGLSTILLLGSMPVWLRSGVTRNISNGIMYVFLIGAGVYVLAQGIIELLGKVRKVGN